MTPRPLAAPPSRAPSGPGYTVVWDGTMKTSPLDALRDPADARFDARALHGSSLTALHLMGAPRGDEA